MISDKRWKQYLLKLDHEQKGARVQRLKGEIAAVKIAGQLAGEGFIQRASSPAKIGKAGRLER